MNSHTKTRTGDLGKAKYPYLPPEKRTEMSDEEYKEYEVNRRDEQEQRAKAYQFSETMYCLDRESGETLWKTEFPSTYTRFVQSSTPCASADRVVVMSAGRIVRCTAAPTRQRPAWRTATIPRFF